MAYLGRVRTIPGLPRPARADPARRPVMRAEALEPALRRRLHGFAGSPLRGARAGPLPGRAARALRSRSRTSARSWPSACRRRTSTVATGGVRGAPSACARGRRRGQEAPAGLDPAADARRSRGAQAAPGRPHRGASSRPPCCGGWPRTSSASTPCCSLWHVRGLEGDRVLLAAAHLLTALGFALLLSRADPLRDTLLIVRYTQGVLVGLGLTALLSWAMAAVAVAHALRLPPAAGRAVPLGPAAALRRRAGNSGAKVNLGPGAADRSHPAPAGAVPRQLLRPPLGAAAPDQRHGVPQPHAAVVARRPQAGLRAAGVGRRRRGAADVLPAEGPRARRSSSRACSWRSMPSRAAAGRWRSSASRRCWPASTWPTAGSCRARWPGAWRCGARRGTTPRPAAIRCRSRCGRWPPAACSAPGSDSARPGSSRPATPI